MATDRDRTPGLERNLRLLDWFVPVSRVYFWTPVFFLFFSERFDVASVLQLEALYYACVVLVEVPSGYFSDRVGRRPTLILSAAATAAAFALFLTAGDAFGIFALAQIAKAVGYAFLSGTDTSLHYDTLVGLGRGEELAAREARFGRNGFAATAAAAVVAGLVGGFDLRIPYALSLLNAVVLLGFAWRFVEPGRAPGEAAAPAFVAQLATCLGFLRRPFLLWLFLYFLLKITTEHIPYTFAQPYLVLVLGEELGDLRRAPLASGLLMAGIAIVGSLAASRSIALRDRLGLGGVLMAAGLLQLGLIGAMAWWLTPFVVPLLLARSVQSAVANPVIQAAVAPSVPQGQRATYLSLHSLAGRLGYSVVLFGLAWWAGGGVADDPAVLTALLRASAVLSAIGLLALAVTAGALRRAPGPPTAGS